MTFIDRLQKLMKDRELSAYKLSRELSISDSLFSKWQKNPNIDPSSTTLNKLSEYFQVSMEWLLTGENTLNLSITPSADLTIKPEIIPSDERLFKLITNNFKALSENGQETLANQSAIILEKERVYQQELAKTRKLTHVKKAVPKENKPSVEPVMVDMFVFDHAASAGLGNYLYEDSSYETMSFNEDDIPNRTSFGVRISGDSMEPEIYHGDIAWVEERLQIEDGQIGIFILNEESYCKKLKIDRDNNAVYLISLNPNYAPIKVSRSDSLRTVGRVLL